MKEKETSEKEEIENEEKNKKREIEGVERKKIGKRRTKSELARERKRQAIPNLIKETPYPLVPSKKDKERYFAHFLDIFKKLEIKIPFGEALQKMPLYTKLLKDLLTKRGKYINNESIVVEGNCSAVIQRILPPKFKDPGSVTIPCSIGLCQWEKH